MDIIAHRGLWQYEYEKNQLSALERAFEEGYGIETDIRDYRGKLVISHDIADDKAPLLEDMLKIYSKLKCSAWLALNIKADGLQNKIMEAVEKYKVINYFLFDMSIPEMVQYKNYNLNYFTRNSDIEASCVLYEYADGVWIDSFFSKNWLSEDIVRCHIEAGKKIGIISPEIHNFPYQNLWEMLKKTGICENSNVLLCTDKPKEARGYFEK